MKDLGKAKTIIGWEITQDIQAGTLKINQKGYIQDLIESEEISLYYLIILPIKTDSTLTLNQVGNLFSTEVIVY